MPNIPQVSFIVPTYNRLPHVLRAVRSCLQTQRHDLSIQVVVSDCNSRDGSWDVLQQEFASDPRVLLLKAPAGSGPLENWLNGARHVTGDFVTYVWSDDYIAPHFLDALLPPLFEGADLAVGQAVERCMDDNSPLNGGGERQTMPLSQFLVAHFTLALPVSPTCSLFSRRAFQNWLENVERFARENPLRNEIMWRRAIGPDLMLYLAAALESGQSVNLYQGVVAQFSSHAGSITCSSSRLPLRLGYWLADAWMLRQDALYRYLSVAHIRQYFTLSLLHGLYFLYRSLCGDPSDRPYRGGILHEMTALCAEMSRRKMLLGVLVHLPGTGIRKLTAKLHPREPRVGMSGL